jgi:hypothetical protein
MLIWGYIIFSIVYFKVYVFAYLSTFIYTIQLNWLHELIVSINGVSRISRGKNYTSPGIRQVVLKTFDYVLLFQFFIKCHSTDSHFFCNFSFISMIFF